MPLPDGKLFDLLNQLRELSHMQDYLVRKLFMLVRESRMNPAERR